MEPAGRRERRAGEEQTNRRARIALSANKGERAMRSHEEGGHLPIRRFDRPRRREAKEKLGLNGTSTVVPMRVRIEVRGGRHTTASTMRAYRVLQEVEGAGASAQIIEVAPNGSTLVAELDGAQAARLANVPFVRRIVSLN